MLKAAAAAEGLAADVRWVSSMRLGPGPASALAPFHAAVVAPQSEEYVRHPESLMKALAFVRTTGTPCLAMCGGAQYALREFARHVLGSPTDVLRMHSCSDHGSAHTGGISGMHPVRLAAGSRASMAYGRRSAEEPFACSYVVDPAAEVALGSAGVTTTGTTPAVGATLFEWESHPFYLATLFLPHLGPAQPHPLLRALVRHRSVREPVRGRTAGRS